MDWKKVTNHLYTNIRPKAGRLISRINDFHNPGIQFGSLWIEFDMNEFFYEDPFYGEQKSTAPFNMNVDLVNYAVQRKINEIYALENITIENTEKTRSGAFSNSLDVVPHYLKFGAITENKIDFEMKYSMTNTDSYGNMDGTFEDHLGSSGIISIPLEICNLQLIVHKANNLQKLLNRINSNVYDLKSLKQIRERSEEIRRDEYEVKYKNIKPKPKKKWWKF